MATKCLKGPRQKYIDLKKKTNTLTEANIFSRKSTNEDRVWFTLMHTAQVMILKVQILNIRAATGVRGGIPKQHALKYRP